MLELEAAARARAGRRRAPAPRGQAAPGHCGHRMQTVDAETHLGGGAYRMWLKDASDTRVRGGRPCFGIAPVSKPTSIGGRPGEDSRTRDDFSETLFMGGPRGGVLFRAAARDGEACAGLKAHFHALFEARRQPWPACARGARRPEQRHPEEALALEAEALALEAEREVALERDRERRGKLKHLKRSEALGEVSSDDEGGYKPGPITMAHGDDEDDVSAPADVRERRRRDPASGCFPRLRVRPRRPPAPGLVPGGPAGGLRRGRATRAASPFPAPRKTRGRRPPGAFASGATPGTRLRPSAQRPPATRKAHTAYRSTGCGSPSRRSRRCPWGGAARPPGAWAGAWLPPRTT